MAKRPLSVVGNDSFAVRHNGPSGRTVRTGRRFREWLHGGSRIFCVGGGARSVRLLGVELIASALLHRLDIEQFAGAEGLASFGVEEPDDGGDGPYQSAVESVLRTGAYHDRTDPRQRSGS